MHVARKVLDRIEDNVSLSEQLAKNPAIADLIVAYNTVLLDELISEDVTLRADIFPVTGDSLGLTLKESVAHLPIAIQHRLLNNYLNKAETLQHYVIETTPQFPRVERRADSEDVVIAREERQLKHSMIKIGFIACLAFVFVVAGAIVAIMVKENKLPDNALVSTLMKTATEIIKVMFNSK